MKTYSLKSTEVTRSWYVIDAEGKPLGRIASKAAVLLRGKHKPTFAPHIDNGDFVIIINADKFILTGRKPKNKLYRHYSGYQGGLKSVPFKEMIVKKPLFPLEKAIKGMLPKNRLAKKLMKKLYLYRGSDHGFKNVALKEMVI